MNNYFSCVLTQYLETNAKIQNLSISTMMIFYNKKAVDLCCQPLNIEKLDF